MSKDTPSIPEISDLFDHALQQCEAASGLDASPRNGQLASSIPVQNNICDTQRPILDPADERFLSDKQVAERLGVSRPTIWRWVKTVANFPRPVSLSPGTSRWRLSDLLIYEAALEEQALGASAKALGQEL